MVRTSVLVMLSALVLASCEQRQCPEVISDASGADAGPRSGELLDFTRLEIVYRSPTADKAPSVFEHMPDGPVTMRDSSFQCHIDPGLMVSKRNEARTVTCDRGKSWSTFYFRCPLQAAAKEVEIGMLVLASEWPKSTPQSFQGYCEYE